jgi:uncharacterized protein YpmB
MKHLPLEKIYIILAILLILFLTFIISCTNVRNNQFTIGKQLKDSNTTIETTETSKETNIIQYTPLPDWQGYDLNPSSSNYKKIYGINKFKDQKIVIAFQQAP